jgi:L-threonylcarbamoyladenylate synthase
MKTEVLPTNHKGCLDRAMHVLNSGGLVAFPTDTVYGLGALAFNRGSIGRLYSVKQRDRERPLPVLISSQDQLSHITVRLNKAAQMLADRFWPGPLTIVVESHPELPDEISSSGTVGIRIPDHAFARELLSRAGPMAVTSANLSNHPASRNAEEVLHELGGKIELVIDGGLTAGQIPSTVVDCTKQTATVLRAGPIGVDQILAVLT